MADIVLTTLNARYIHAAFGLRYLLANLGPLRGRARLLEFDIHQRPAEMIETILAQDPQIVGIGVYIWNAAQSTQLVADLKRLRPELLVVLGGPEVSYETEQQEIVRLADYVVAGEADLTFAGLCGRLLNGERPAAKIIRARLPQFEELALPYDLYDELLETRLIDFPAMQRLKRFARYWDLVANSGNFVETTPRLWQDGSPFAAFLEFSDWLYARVGRTHAVSLFRLAELLFEHLCDEKGFDRAKIGPALSRDYQRGGRNDCPAFLREHVAAESVPRARSRVRFPRQARHLG